MKCPFCGKQISRFAMTCPNCRAEFQSVPIPQKKAGNNWFLTIVVILLLLIPYGMGIARLLPSLPVRLSSTKVEAVISQADPVRHSTSFSSKKSSNGSFRKTYTLTITQRIMVEFTLDGEMRRGDLGSIELMKQRSTMDFSQEEIDRYVERHALTVGEPLTVYVRDNGEVAITEEIDAQLFGGLIFVAIGNLLVILFIWWKIEHRRKKKKADI